MGSLQHVLSPRWHDKLEFHLLIKNLYDAASNHILHICIWTVTQFRVMNHVPTQSLWDVYHGVLGKTCVFKKKLLMTWTLQHIEADSSWTSQIETRPAVHTLPGWGIPQAKDPFDKTTWNPLNLCSCGIIALIRLPRQIHPHSTAFTPETELQGPQWTSISFEAVLLDF